MKKSRKCLWIVKTFALGSAAVYLFYYVIQVQLYRSQIPQIIETEILPVTIDSEIGVLASCGIGVFRIKRDTLFSINKIGVSFFDYAKEASVIDPFSLKKESRYYSHWQETPIPEDFFSDGWWPFAAGCDSSLSWAEMKAISCAARSPGSYYTALDRSGWLLVLPDLKMVMFIHDE